MSAKVMRLDNILQSLDEGHTKVAGEAAAAPGNVRETGKRELLDQLGAGQTKVAAATAAVAASAGQVKTAAVASPAGDLEKIAASVIAAEEEGIVKQAHAYGAAVCDGFMARMSHYEAAGEKVAAEGGRRLPVSAFFKTAGARPSERMYEDSAGNVFSETEVKLAMEELQAEQGGQTKLAADVYEKYAQYGIEPEAVDAADAMIKEAAAQGFRLGEREAFEKVASNAFDYGYHEIMEKAAQVAHHTGETALLEKAAEVAYSQGFEETMEAAASLLKEAGETEAVAALEKAAFDAGYEDTMVKIAASAFEKGAEDMAEIIRMSGHAA